MINGMKGILFDMDGLLFDTESVWQKNWKLEAEKRGYEYPEVFPQYICGTSGESMYAAILKFFPNVDAVEFAAKVTAQVAEDVSHGVEPMPGLHEILKQAKEKGYRIAVASSSPMAQIKSNLEREGILHFFDALTSSKEVANGKPSPDVFLLAAKRIGLDPKECLVFEDGLNGIRAGVAAGCTCIMIPDLVAPDEYAKEHCYGIYKSLLDVEL